MDAAPRSWNIAAGLFTAAVHPRHAGLAVAGRTGGAAALRGPFAAALEVDDLQCRAIVIRPAVITLRARRTHLRAGRQPRLEAHVVQVDEEVFVLPSMRHGDVAIRAAEILHRALARVAGMEIGVGRTRAGRAAARATEAALQRDGIRQGAGGEALAVIVVVVAAETQAVGLRRAGLIVPGSLKQKDVVRAVGSPRAALRTAAGYRAIIDVGVGAVAVGAVHGLHADAGIEGRAPDVGAAHVTHGDRAPRFLDDRMPGTVIVVEVVDGIAAAVNALEGTGRRGQLHRVGQLAAGARHLALVLVRRLVLHRLIGVLEHRIGVGRRRAVGEAERWRRVVPIARVTFETHLIFTRDVGGARGRTAADTWIAAFDFEMRGFAAEFGGGPAAGFDARDTAQHAGRQISVDAASGRDLSGSVVVCAFFRIGHGWVVVEQTIARETERVVTVRAFGVTISEIALAHVHLCLDEVLAALLIVQPGTDVVYLAHSQLIGVGDRHVTAHGREISLDIGHTKARKRALVDAGVDAAQDTAVGGVTGVTGLLDGRLTAVMESGAARRDADRTVRALAQDAPRTLHGVRIVAVQTRGLPHLRAARKLAQIGGRVLIGIGRDLRVGVGRAGPAGLVVAGKTNDVVVRVERVLYRLCLLETVHAQEFDVFAGGVADMRVVAADALDAILFERQGWGRPFAASAIADLRHRRRVVQFTVACGLRAVEGEGDRMIIGEIHADLTREAGGGSQALGYGVSGADAGTGEIDIGVFRAIEYVHCTQGERAVVAGETEFRFGARLTEVDSNERTRGVRRVGDAGQFAIPDRRLGRLGRAVRCVAKGAELRFAGGGGVALRAVGQFGDVVRGDIVPGVADV